MDKKGWPLGLKSVRERLGMEQRRMVFDPALKHYPDAFRYTDPQLTGEAQQRWHAARAIVIDHLLAAIGQSRWHKHLVLRGSLLLKAWLGEAAREPGDIDWVFQPATVPAKGQEAALLFGDLATLATGLTLPEGLRVEGQGIRVDDIWTYDRAAGRRILIPWQAEGLPFGEVQMDVVFCEQLHLASEPVALSLSGELTTEILAASMEESLVWKLLWLVTDNYPQGKDLYDAALLAENCTVPPDLVARVIPAKELGWRGGDLVQMPFHLDIEWDDFKTEYPWVPGSLADWQQRLSQALQCMSAAAG